jgi:hypothetical protein
MLTSIGRFLEARDQGVPDLEKIIPSVLMMSSKKEEKAAPRPKEILGTEETSTEANHRLKK